MHAYAQAIFPHKRGVAIIAKTNMKSILVKILTLTKAECSKISAQKKNFNSGSEKETEYHHPSYFSNKRCRFH